MKRTTVFLSEECHERLRRESFRMRISMAELIRRKLDVSEPPTDDSAEESDPILALAGMCTGGPSLTENLDEELYDL